MARTDLLTHLAADVPGWQLERTGAATARLAPPTGPPFTVEVHEERRRLLQLATITVVVPGPAPSGPVHHRLVLHHTGHVRRTGLVAVVRPVDRRHRHAPVAAEVPALRDRLLADGELERASLALDVTRFEVAVVDGRWQARLELMGASHVRTTLPPSARYVRLPDDQRAPLLATTAVLHDRLPGVTSVEGVDDASAQEARSEPTRETSPSRGHLPRRR